MYRFSRRDLKYCVVIILLLMSAFLPQSIWAATSSIEKIENANHYLKQAIDFAKSGKLSEAENLYNQFHEHWEDIEHAVKIDSSQTYQDIESNIGTVEYGFKQKKQDQIIQSLQSLIEVNMKYIKGSYIEETSELQETSQNLTLAEFIEMLEKLKNNFQSLDQQAIESELKKVNESWYIIEGTVLVQSDAAYQDSERDLASIKALVQNNEYGAAENLITSMISYLKPLASKTSYSLWDAMMIVLREGLEALLIIAALLAFVKKSNENRGKGWIWSGVISGLIVSVLIAILVQFIFTSYAFGKNNFLIAGWTAIISAVMLLYMSYWLHSKSNIAEWNRYIQERSKAAIATGSLISFGFLSFLAVFREGTESVLFVIGMINQIQLQDLILGMIIGFGLLTLLAFLILFIGVKLPIRLFFLISSFIVFYLCIKITGHGIHSLQLAGILPISYSSTLPSIDFIGFFPSWVSTLPQIMLVIIAVAVIIWNRLKKSRAL